MWIRVPVGLLLTFTLAAQVAGVSRQKELALGAALASEFRKRSTVVAGTDTDGRIERIVGRLAGATPVYAWNVAVVREDTGGATPQAATFPGGYLFVPAALLATARSDDDLAAMLAHSMAHVLERHGFRQGSGPQVYMGV